MGIEAIIALAFKIGSSAIPKLVDFIADLREGNPPTQEEIDTIWARHKAAFDTIMSEDPATHPQE